MHQEKYLVAVCVQFDGEAFDEHGSGDARDGAAEAGVCVLHEGDGFHPSQLARDGLSEGITGIYIYLPVPF